VLLLAGKAYAQGNAGGLLLPFLLGIGMALPWPLAGAGLSLLPKPGRWMIAVKYIFGALILLLAVHYGRLAFSLFSYSVPAYYHNLETELAAASAAGETVLLDFSAEWCGACKQLEKETFPDSAVRDRLEKYRFIKIDATNFEQSPAKEILDYYNIQGLPAYIILKPVN